MKIVFRSPRKCTGTVFRRCAQADVSLASNFRRKPCHTRRRHERADRECADVCAWPNCRGTFCYSLCGDKLECEGKISPVFVKLRRLRSLTNIPNIDIPILLLLHLQLVSGLRKLGQLLGIGQIQSRYARILCDFLPSHILRVIRIWLGIGSLIIIGPRRPHCHTEFPLHRLYLYLPLFPAPGLVDRLDYVAHYNTVGGLGLLLLLLVVLGLLLRLLDDR
jgi:hypothetical protein